ncbi:hypothetical protein USB125703_01385 [Pseudoclavibacter triregionum]|nr:hypothetical protein USB125703_01385 [Pseudoclavibacter triregionum]
MSGERGEARRDAAAIGADAAALAIRRPPAARLRGVVVRECGRRLVAAANPEFLFLEDFQGKGRQPFEALLSNPGLASVPAIANDRIVLVPMTQAFAISGANTPDGYRTIVEAVSGAK